MIMGFTKPIEHFNLQRKKVITINTLYVGIDVSSKSNVVSLGFIIGFSLFYHMTKGIGIVIFVL